MPSRAPVRKRPVNPPTPKLPTIYLVKVMDLEGKITFRALMAAEYKKLQADLLSGYTAKDKVWLAAKKEAQ